jgi:hypothetical protein
MFNLQGWIQPCITYFLLAIILKGFDLMCTNLTTIMSFFSFICTGQSYKYYLSRLLSFKMSRLKIMLKLSKKWKKLEKKT